MANANGTMRHTTKTTGHMTGWITFAGLMMIVAGFFQSIYGLVAIFKEDLLIASNNHLLLLDYNQWGWVHLGIGIILVLSAASLYGGHLWGRIIAVTLATVSALASFGFIWAYPLWSLMIIALDIMIIYAVIMYGGQSDYEEYE